MAFIDQYDLSQDTASFQKKVAIAMAKTAVAIVGEASSGNGNTDKKRHDLGVDVLRNPDNWIDQFSRAVVTNATISATSTDSEIENQVIAVWNDIAGVGNG